MSAEYILVLLVVAVFSVIQSFFGMGILVFGTPTLLMLGFEFSTTLGYLLPASFAISLFQVTTRKFERPAISNYLYLLCLPSIGIGLWLAHASQLASLTKVFIGVMLLVSALIRFKSSLQTPLNAVIKKQSAVYHIVMGVIHGMTNLGGALLAVLASGTNDNREAIRYVVAHYYLVFTSVQMAVLSLLLGHFDLLISGLPTALVAAFVFISFGNKYFARTNDSKFHLALSLFMGAYGVIILLFLET